MNQTSHTEEPWEGEGNGMNQSPNAFSNDLITNQDLNGIANSRRKISSRSMDNSGQPIAEDISPTTDEDPDGRGASTPNLAIPCHTIGQASKGGSVKVVEGYDTTTPDDRSIESRKYKNKLDQIKYTIITFGKFCGPGFLVAVAYSEFASFFFPPISLL